MFICDKAYTYMLYHSITPFNHIVYVCLYVILAYICCTISLHFTFLLVKKNTYSAPSGSTTVQTADYNPPAKKRLTEIPAATDGKK